MLTSDEFNEWTACEVNGHKYEDTESDARRCIYCGDEY